MLHYSAPGKLFISGEWSVLEVGNVGLVAAVNNRVHVTVERNSNGIIITASEFNITNAHAKYENGQTTFDGIDEKAMQVLALLREAISTSLRYIEEKDMVVKNFKISTSSKEAQITIDGQPRKIGFGSSAAVVVACIAAILDFHDYKAKKEEIYKLSTIAHYYAQGKVGSGFDVAASTYGGLFVYSHFDPDLLTAKLESGTLLSTIIKERWPGLVIEELRIPEKFHLLVGWTKTSASTTAMIKQMNEFKKNHRSEYDEHFNNIALTAKRAIDAFKKKRYQEFQKTLIENEKLLAVLGKESGVDIETNDLKKLSDIAAMEGGAGKLSGAGGGDCGIAVCFDAETEERIKRAWKGAGIYAVDTTIDREGVKKEK